MLKGQGLPKANPVVSSGGLSEVPFALGEGVERVVTLFLSAVSASVRMVPELRARALSAAGKREVTDAALFRSAASAQVRTAPNNAAFESGAFNLRRTATAAAGMDALAIISTDGLT